MIPKEFFTTHRIAVSVVCAVLLWISLFMIGRMWIVHRRAPLVKKLLWSVMLLVPVLGWIFYGAWFQVPEASGNGCQPTRDAFYGGSGHF